MELIYLGLREREALSILNQHRIQGAQLQKAIKWSFNPPGASHHGGVWERLIRSVKQVLYSVLKQQTLDEEGLLTLLCEVEAILNSQSLQSPITPKTCTLLTQTTSYFLTPSQFCHLESLTRTTCTLDTVGNRCSTWQTILEALEPVILALHAKKSRKGVRIQADSKGLVQTVKVNTTTSWRGQ